VPAQGIAIPAHRVEEAPVNIPRHDPTTDDMYPSSREFARDDEVDQSASSPAAGASDETAEVTAGAGMDVNDDLVDENAADDSAV
jgi:hypothetical protein